VRGGEEDSLLCSCRAAGCTLPPPAGLLAVAEWGGDGDGGGGKGEVHAPAREMVGAHAGGWRFASPAAAAFLCGSEDGCVLRTCHICLPPGTGPPSRCRATDSRPGVSEATAAGDLTVPCVLDRGRGEDGREIGNANGKRKGECGCFWHNNKMDRVPRKKKRQSRKYKWQKMMPMIKNDFSRGLFERESFQPII